jgi:hypothetical protein
MPEHPPSTLRCHGLPVVIPRYVLRNGDLIDGSIYFLIFYSSFPFFGFISYVTYPTSLLPSSPLPPPPPPSLFCAAMQRGISFNQVFGWEMTLLDPKEYWRKVPAKWKPYWHFFNTPISADPLHADSPVRLIKQIATPGDRRDGCLFVVPLLLCVVTS